MLFSLADLDVGSIFAIIIPFTHSKNITCRILNARYHKTLTIFTFTNNTPCLLPKLLHENCFQFLLGIGILSKNEILRKFPYCPNLCFKVRQRAKRLIRNCFYYYYYYSHANRNLFFFKEDLASSWKWEFFLTRKWPIEDCLICTILENKQVVLGESENG